MRITGKNFTATVRRRAIRLLAAFFVLYALADVSVLQAYCGNEMVGIPPAHHSVETADDSVQSHQENCTETEKAGCRQSPGNQDYDHPHECFCWHKVIVESFLFDSTLLPELPKTLSTAIYENKHPNSDPSGFFRPPQTA